MSGLSDKITPEVEPKSPLELFFLGISNFFASWRFPTLAISLLVFFNLFILSILIIPESAGTLGAFAGDFKIWCLGYDPATGKIDWGYTLPFIMAPLILSGVLLSFWGRELKDIFRRKPLSTLPYMLSSLVLVILGGILFTFMEKSDNTQSLPFPAEQLRTAFHTPTFHLPNQNGQMITPTELKGKVLILTGVYTHCVHTCPLILQQVKQIFEQFSPSEKEQLGLVAVTLDPEHDDRKALHDLAKMHHLEAPLYNLVNGSPGTVNELLDNLSIARTKDPVTQRIDHANLFILVDRQGKIAYRFSLGKRQEEWLTKALRILLDEKVS